MKESQQNIAKQTEIEKNTNLAAHSGSEPLKSGQNSDYL